MKSTSAKPVMDGRRIKWTLERVFQQNQSAVHIDWLRFTLPLAAVVKSDRNLNPDLTHLDLMDQRGRDLVRATRSVDADLQYSGPMAVAASGAALIAETLGIFTVGAVEDRGMDYYAARAALTFEGETVGFVLAGGKSSKQASTVHVNIFGSALLQISHAKLAAVKALVDGFGGWLTRVDLAVDVFAGRAIEEVRDAYLGGEFNVRGKRPGQREHGSWTLGHSRTFEVGSRDTGKLMRAYEKGDQLFGNEAADPWLRYEVELRSNHRIIDTEVLTRPADFFAGCYPFCQRLLDELGEENAAQVIPTRPEVADKTAEAAVDRVARWVRNTAMPAVKAMFWHGGDALASLIETEHRTPRRLRGNAPDSVREAWEKVAAAFVPATAPFATGTT